MVLRRRRRWLPVLLLLALLVVAGCTGPASDRAALREPEAVPPTVATQPPAPPAPAAQPLAAGRPALVVVSVANVWKAPGRARPVDAPSLRNPVDIKGWIAAMTHEDKLWLVDHLVTQALYGERVRVDEISGDWARVVVTGQPTHLDPAGYPGWIPVVQLRAGELPAVPTTAVVTRPVATLRIGDPLELSYNTRLPVLSASADEVTVGLPTGSPSRLATSDVVLSGPGPRPVSGEEVVAGARQFSGLPYLWAGTSSAGFDCSGFTAAVYGVHGIVLPRDADDQAGAGTPVDRSRLQPGDLLFYATGPDQRSIHHVSMYVGNGMMIQAPATGRTVETVPVDTPSYARQFWGARRYL
jgi:gamma-D-glutamyl-L-lysine dipeptidyl-peptidase